jgi:hypothetical protein
MLFHPVFSFDDRKRSELSYPAKSFCVVCACSVNGTVEVTDVNSFAVVQSQLRLKLFLLAIPTDSPVRIRRQIISPMEIARAGHPKMTSLVLRLSFVVSCERWLLESFVRSRAESADHSS